MKNYIEENGKFIELKKLDSTMKDDIEHSKEILAELGYKEEIQLYNTLVHSIIEFSYK